MSTGRATRPGTGPIVPATTQVSFINASAVQDFIHTNLPPPVRQSLNRILRVGDKAAAEGQDVATSQSAARWGKGEGEAVAAKAMVHRYLRMKDAQGLRYAAIWLPQEILKQVILEFATEKMGEMAITGYARGSRTRLWEQGEEIRWLLRSMSLLESRDDRRDVGMRAFETLLSKGDVSAAKSVYAEQAFCLGPKDPAKALNNVAATLAAAGMSSRIEHAGREFMINLEELTDASTLRQSAADEAASLILDGGNRGVMLGRGLVGYFGLRPENLSGKIAALLVECLMEFENANTTTNQDIIRAERIRSAGRALDDFAGAFTSTGDVRRAQLGVVEAFVAKGQLREAGEAGFVVKITEQELAGILQGVALRIPRTATE